MDSVDTVAFSLSGRTLAAGGYRCSGRRTSCLAWPYASSAILDARVWMNGTTGVVTSAVAVIATSSGPVPRGSGPSCSGGASARLRQSAASPARPSLSRR